MSDSITLEYENARALASLFANDVKLLKQAEDSLGVKMTTRDGWVRAEGSPEQLETVRSLFSQLDRAKTSGLNIRKSEFLYALKAVNNAEMPGLDELADVKIQCSPRRPPVTPKTQGQRNYVTSIQKSDLVFGLGPAGTGKTYLAMAMAVAALKREEITRIILTRPAVEAGEALGFLPGDLKEKIMPYLRPLYDALYDMLESDEMERYLERGVIEVAPLAYMRGRTLNRAFVVLDEAQNTTTEQMFMFLTRLGAESKAVITGDTTQIDLPTNKRSGLVEALQALREVDGIAFCRFEDRDVIRHELVQSIVRAYRQHRGTEVENKR
jgi:phosphate starvation-inducible PhoH-like protein